MLLNYIFSLKIYIHFYSRERQYILSVIIEIYWKRSASNPVISLRGFNLVASNEYNFCFKNWNFCKCIQMFSFENWDVCQKCILHIKSWDPCLLGQNEMIAFIYFMQMFLSFHIFPLFWPNLSNAPGSGPLLKFIVIKNATINLEYILYIYIHFIVR